MTPRPSPFPAASAAAVCCAALLAAAPAAAQTAFLESGPTAATGNTYQSFRIPTRGADGKLRYWDLTVTLAIGADGRPAPTAAVTAAASPKFPGSHFIAGTYKDLNGDTCTLSTGFLPSGRQEAALTCPAGIVTFGLTASWTSGPIAGHPFEPDLVIAGIDTIAGNPSSSWGKVATTGGGGRSVWLCFAPNHVISARQAGDQLLIGDYGGDTVVDCGMTLTLQR